MSNITTYDIGDVATLTGTFKTHAGVLSDPTAVVVEVIDPAGIKTEYTSVTHASTGVYTYDLPLTSSGLWSYHFEGTGAVQAAGESYLRVNPTKF